MLMGLMIPAHIFFIQPLETQSSVVKKFNMKHSCIEAIMCPIWCKEWSWELVSILLKSFEQASIVKHSFANNSFDIVIICRLDLAMTVNPWPRNAQLSMKPLLVHSKPCHTLKKIHGKRYVSMLEQTQLSSLSGVVVLSRHPSPLVTTNPTHGNKSTDNFPCSYDDWYI